MVLPSIGTINPGNWSPKAHSASANVLSRKHQHARSFCLIHYPDLFRILHKIVISEHGQRIVALFY